MALLSPYNLIEIDDGIIIWEARYNYNLALISGKLERREMLFDSVYVDVSANPVSNVDMYHQSTQFHYRTMIRSGSVVGLSAAVNPVTATGTIKVQAYISSVALPTAICTVGAGNQFNFMTITEGNETFVAGDYLHLKYSTISTVAVGTDLMATVWLIHD